MEIIAADCSPRLSPLSCAARVSARISRIDSGSSAAASYAATISCGTVAADRQLPAATAAARGGWAQMSQSDWGYTGALIKRQYQYLDRFALDIQTGKQRLDGRLLQRARMYGKAARSSYEQMRRREMVKLGKTEERRLLGPAEHCPGCLIEADKEWRPIGTLAPIGSQECRTECKCYFVFR
jgi:hypothetical protein